MPKNSKKWWAEEPLRKEPKNSMVFFRRIQRNGGLPLRTEEFKEKKRKEKKRKEKKRKEKKRSAGLFQKRRCVSEEQHHLETTPCLKQEEKNSTILALLFFLKQTNKQKNNAYITTISQRYNSSTLKNISVEESYRCDIVV